ncbi:hypothetical protein [Shivajiella indica]|uniref:Uncharacterized protein n=1 Tax=Shivajiella indica TaxID=872115 RepID=A0ABW5BCA7_9BACT
MSLRKQTHITFLTLPLLMVVWLFLGTTHLQAQTSYEDTHFFKISTTSQSDFYISDFDHSSVPPSDLPVGKENEGQEEGESEVEESETFNCFLIGDRVQLKLLIQRVEAKNFSFFCEILNTSRTPYYILFHSWKSDLT